MTSGIIKVEVSVISRAGTETLIIPDITKTVVLKKITTSESTSHFFTSLCARCHSPPVNLTLLLEIMHCAYNLQTIHRSASVTSRT